MKPVLRAFVALTLCISLVPSAYAGTDTRSLAATTNVFAVRLYKRLVAEKPAANLFFSPNSIFLALAMTYEGARGRTQGEMSATLGIADSVPSQLRRALVGLIGALRGERKVELRVANALFLHRKQAFLGSFISAVRKTYKASTQLVDFAKPEHVREQINRWVAKETRSLIKQIIPPGLLTPADKLVLANAIYFKGNWQIRFDPKRTQDGLFQRANGSKVSVRMMHLEAKLGFYQAPSFKVLSLAYSGDTVSMLVVLPNRGVKLASVEAQLRGATLESWLKQLRQQKTNVSFPRFEASWFASLKPTLKALGMPIAFTPHADFSGMTGKPELMISDVLHKAFITVSEAGTKAGAATVVVMTRGRSLHRVPEFRADRPFLYLIRHNKTGAILFIGRMLDPTSGRK